MNATTPAATPKIYYQVQRWDGRHGDNTPSVADRCAHRHRTESAAKRCLDALLAYNPRARTWSARWHAAQVVPVDRTGTYCGWPEAPGVR